MRGRRRAGCWHEQAGFSLLEALFVAAILGILLALAMPSYHRVLMERRVQNVTREVAADLRVAQQAAVAESAEAKCVVVAFENRRLAVYVIPDDEQHASFDCADPDPPGGVALLSSHEYPVGVTVTSPREAVAFLPSGELQPPGFSVTVAGGGHTRAVCVNAAGLVSVPPPGGSCQ